MSTTTEPTMSSYDTYAIERSTTDANAAGIEIHEANTIYGRMFFTIEGPDVGQVWSDRIVTINRIPHVMGGEYRFGYEHDSSSGSWAPNPDKPVARLGYRGLVRKDRGQYEGDAPTNGAYDKLSRELGRVIAPYMADPTEAEANARELKARDNEFKAAAQESEAERCIERAMSYRAEANRIRNG